MLRRKSSTNAGSFNEGRRQAWRWMWKTEARRNKRKEGKNRIRTLRADSAGGEWINVFTCPKAQRFQRTRQSHSSPFPSPGWNEMHIYKQAYMLMWFSTFYENCGNPVNQAYAEILQACDLILKPQLLIFMSWVTFDRFFFFKGNAQLSFLKEKKRNESSFSSLYR